LSSIPSRPRPCTSVGDVIIARCRGLADENEIVTFGFFDGMLEELERSHAEGDYDGRRAPIEPYVDAVLANGVARCKSAACPTSPRRPSGPPGAARGSCRHAPAR
jgi:hypothetical protein